MDQWQGVKEPQTRPERCTLYLVGVWAGGAGVGGPRQPPVPDLDSSAGLRAACAGSSCARLLQLCNAGLLATHPKEMASSDIPSTFLWSTFARNCRTPPLDRHPPAAPVQQYVVRLQVSVHDVACMGMCQRAQGLVHRTLLKGRGGQRDGTGRVGAVSCWQVGPTQQAGIPAPRLASLAHHPWHPRRTLTNSACRAAAGCASKCALRSRSKLSSTK